jgi:hypothetical protein
MPASRKGPPLLGPDLEELTLNALPAQGPSERWSMMRKGRVIAAVQHGLLSLDEACARYAMSVDEYLSWESALQRHGLSGLRALAPRELAESVPAREWQSG